MNEKGNSKINEIFKQLNNDDKDHAKRISSYMKSYGIQLGSENGNYSVKKLPQRY